jgi:hypothetical protein
MCWTAIVRKPLVRQTVSPVLTPAAVLLVLRHLKRDQAHRPQKADTIVATP